MMDLSTSIAARGARTCQSHEGVMPADGSFAERFNGQEFWHVLLAADSDEVARAFRDDLARRSDMMSPGVPR
jgi:hypothetical protein